MLRSVTASNPSALSTEAIITQARALQACVLPGQKHSLDNPAKSALRTAAREMIAAALYRDLSAAMVQSAKLECAANGEEFLYEGAPYTLLASDSFQSDGGREAPKRHTEQEAWRDYTGWLCKTERMAKWVARWVATHLDPRDSDGNTYGASGSVRRISNEGKADMWLAVTGAYKVAD